MLFGNSHCLPNSQRVHAVYAVTRNAKAHSSARESIFLRGLGNGGAYCIEVVFDKENQRYIPCCREVHALEHTADVYRSVPKIGNGQIICTRVKLIPGIAGG